MNKPDMPRVYAAGEYKISSQLQPELHERMEKLERVTSALRGTKDAAALVGRLTDDVLPALLIFNSAVIAKLGNVEVWAANLDERLLEVEEGAPSGIDEEDGKQIIDALVALAAVAKSLDLAAIGEENAKVVREALEKGEKALALVEEAMVGPEGDADEEDDEGR
jgi:hypothetical protein